jgi:hypothetical protein
MNKSTPDPSPDSIFVPDYWRYADVETIAALLEVSDSEESFIYREAELDEFWRYVDDESREGGTSEKLEALDLLRASALRAHDLVAESRCREAARDLQDTWQLVRGCLMSQGAEPPMPVADE